MRGNNQLHLNTATMVEALQQWIDGKMPNGAPVVTNISVEQDHTFIVWLSGETDRPGPQPPSQKE